MPETTTLTPADLEQFSGTTVWFNHPFVSSLLYTEGVQHFAIHAQAYWFLDIVATELWPKLRDIPFMHIAMNVRDEQATITADDGDGVVFWKKEIVFTDCPPGLWRFYLTDSTLLLPSEY